MSLRLRLAPDQDDREFVTLIADRGQVRMIAKVARPVIEDAFPDADYVRDRLGWWREMSTSLPGLSRRRLLSGTTDARATTYRDLVGLKLK
jgi:hypothetical protein